MFGNPYIFVSTDEKRIVDAFGFLQSTDLEPRYADAQRNTYLFARAKQDFPCYLSVINDQGDYSIREDVQRALEKQVCSRETDSLVSFAHVDQNRFVAKTDLWGIQHHYYYHKGRTFICSNNCLLIAKLVDARFDEESLFDYLFFLSPNGDRSWFEGVRLLRPDQAIVYDIASGSFSVTEETDLYNEMTVKPSVDLVDAMSSLYEKASAVLRKARTLMSLSAGSDSRTVLSGLLGSGMDVDIVSFGGENFLETRNIRALAKARGLAPKIYDFADLLSNWTETFHSASLVTNGLLNPFRVHYGNYYRSLEGDALFEGFVGSEFVKGEIAVGAAASECHVAVIRDKLDVGQAIESTLGFLPDAYRSRMQEYIIERYRGVLQPVESSGGKKEFARQMLESVPGRVFNPLHALACARLKLYMPFLSRRVLRAVFQSYGVVHYNSLRRDFPGTVKCLIPECLIVKHFDQRLYRSRLDRRVTFAEALELPLFVSDSLRRSRVLLEKLTVRGLHRGQVDAALLAAAAERFLRENSATLEDGFPWGRIEGKHLLSKRCNLICLKQLMMMDLKQMVDTLLNMSTHR
jgi:hypothetical protein